MHPTRTADPDIVEEALDHVLRKTDIASRDGVIHQALLADIDDTNLKMFCSAASELLAEVDIQARVGAALFPANGSDAAALIAAADADAEHSTEQIVDGMRIIVVEESMKRLHAQAKQIAVGTISVLLLGETGSGKEILAEAIHRASPRRAQPFLRINCAALSDTLLESELFGHERGAFTGATQTKPGLLETAHKGTVFLDEIGELSAAVQAKLLRVLEDGQVMRVGGRQPRQVDVRFVTATNHCALCSPASLRLRRLVPSFAN